MPHVPVTNMIDQKHEDEIGVSNKTDKGVGDSDKMPGVSNKTDDGVGDSDKMPGVSSKTDDGVGDSDKMPGVSSDKTCGVTAEIDPKFLDSGATGGDGCKPVSFSKLSLES